MTPPRTPLVGVAAGLGLALALGGNACSVERSAADRPSGVHPPGWKDQTSAEFHASWLKSNKFPLSRCQTCHGTDYAGGPSKVSCTQASCHAQPPSDCTTCHGSNGTPRPTTGAHQAHAPYCDTCHQVPTPAEIEKHASSDPSTLIHFGGLAVTGGRSPTWDRSAARCANTYCHGPLSPVWTAPTPGPLACDGCHGAPPASHQRWARLTATSDSCANCHPPPTDPRHRNGVVDLLPGVTCTTCHGSGNHVSPPTALDGSADPTSRGVGAHQRHLDPELPDRSSRAFSCETCHQVPSSVLDPGHIEGSSARVRFPFGGTYDAASGTCVVGCHFDKKPGPLWTNASGSARACNGCHDFPPSTTRNGTPHPSVASDVALCRICHLFEPSTHVDGVVEFAP